MPDETTQTTVTETKTTSVPVVKAVETESVNMVPQPVVDRITAEKHEAIRAKMAAESQLSVAQSTIEELRKVKAESGETSAVTATTTTPEKTKPISGEELQRLVNERAQVQQFNEACNKSVEEGRKTHTDFDKVVLGDLTKLSPIYDPRAGGPIIPQPLVEAALETGEAHEVLYALGKDPTSAERIMRLSPIKQAVEIARFYDKLVAGRPGKDEETDETAKTEETETEADETVSRAPAPIRTRSDRGTSNSRPVIDVLKPEKSSMTEWMAARQNDLDKKKRNGSARR